MDFVETMKVPSKNVFLMTNQWSIMVFPIVSLNSEISL